MPTATGRRPDPQRLILTVALVTLALLWLVPVVWVLVTSLKLSENIVRLPPEWIPWPATGSHYHEVLFSSSRTARIGRAFLNSLVVSHRHRDPGGDHLGHGRVSAGAHALPRPRSRLRGSWSAA